jgi:hypothetical protein
MLDTSPPTGRHVALRASALALVVLALGACANSSDRDPADGPIAEDPHLIGHVHGLGIDPADGTVYAAGHFGVFRIDETGTATRIADRWQDTMAFTVTGPGTFLASGHPDLREDLPPHLGLIESTDAGETWQNLSLQGKADFHALEVVGDRVYGYDATTGRLMTTTDRESWTTITEGQFVDIAVAPSRPDRVVVTTPSGAVHEVRLNGSSRPLGTAPGLVWIDSDPDGRLVGITADGDLFTAAGADGKWQRAGRVPGTPAALEVAQTAWYAATDEGIFTSTDRGASWAAVLVGAQE